MASGPRWKQAIENALAANENSTAVTQLASIDPTSPIPYVRCLIFRGFIIPTTNPELPMLLFTTDSRTPKTSQIISNPHVQLAWWIEGTKEQYRVAGLATIIPAPTNDLYKHFLHSTHANGTMAMLYKESFDWEAKRQEVYRSMSPYMKASWCRPTPGTPLVGGEEEAKKWPVKLEEPNADGEWSSEENKHLWETALSHFALLVVDPTDVDYVELGPVPNRRTKFWKDDKDSWNDEALVP
ncbi:uncharacterized protein BT62DRAFT_925995 [Guyanagaster necrorhizus]|uniref:Pyridoxamine 5'-phosphate oxidase Alr4036 family FMN-binding domain-containing protein n=1 Tax=Guyanagaster necrorhizus TaxID=856835 RepID=A0A9P7W482_9AGAR|nr:uncharacterized protein BT62DRAFT_925995 [Guyanagaster necrorhizus MCA 3950]KAG7451814.1 hypothetical protein BT62DRAFT_925995 [Guyanagaster necrorhizus MCA 3950]